MNKSVLLLASCILVASCETPTGTRPQFAYDPTVLSRGALYRWPSGKQIRVWAEAPPQPSAVPPVDLAQAVRQAMIAWNALPLYAEFSLTSATSIGDADIVVYDRAIANPITPGNCPFDPLGAAGYTYFCPSTSHPGASDTLALASGIKSSAAVVIRVDRGRIADQNSYLALVTHELGHALGIGGHSDQAKDVMYGAPTAPLPTARDAQTLRYLLGRRADLSL